MFSPYVSSVLFREEDQRMNRELELRRRRDARARRERLAAFLADVRDWRDFLWGTHPSRIATA